MINMQKCGQEPLKHDLETVSLQRSWPKRGNQEVDRAIFFYSFSSKTVNVKDICKNVG